MAIAKIQRTIDINGKRTVRNTEELVEKLRNTETLLDEEDMVSVAYTMTKSMSDTMTVRLWIKSGAIGYGGRAT